MKKIRQYFTDALARYRQWQRNYKLHLVTTMSDERQHCYCCDHDYVGNFCPVCGQRAGSKHITWATVWKGVLDLWGVGTRSLPYSVWQLIWRPGYFMADYISGRRQVSFPPIKMLVFVALAILFLSNRFFPDQPDDDPTQITEGLEIIEQASVWFSHHYDWGALVCFSFFILPTYIIFRYSPRCPHHTLPEGFFVQVFNSVQFLFLVLPVNYLADLLIPSNDHEGIISSILAMGTIALFLYLIARNYHQLFGYNWWSNAWRLLAVIVAGIFMLFVLIQIIFCYHLVEQHEWVRLTRNVFRRLIPYVLVCALILWGTHRINLRSFNRRQKRQHSEETTATEESPASE